MSTAPTREDAKRYLHGSLLKPAGEFVNSVLWLEFKRALMARAPGNPDTSDEPHVAAAKAFKNNGWREAVEELERLPFETPPEGAPVIPESLLDPKD